MRSLIFLLLFSFNATAALYDRGNGLIYDDALDITWLQDANYAETSGWASENQVNLAHTSGNVQPNGSMSWFKATEWVQGLEYAGSTNWRLPSILNSTNETGYNIHTGELGWMFYSNLGGVEQQPVPQNNIFTNIQHAAYWYEETSPHLASERWYFSMIYSYQHNAGANDSWYAWPVHDGDIGASPVPLPAGIWLFTLGLISLRLFKR